MSTVTHQATPAFAGQAERTKEATAAAFALAASVTVLFNVVLAFVKDSSPALNSFMASLTGHHWRTHGLVDVIVFFLLGWLFMSRGIPAGGLTGRSGVGVVAASTFQR